MRATELAKDITRFCDSDVAGTVEEIVTKGDYKILLPLIAKLSNSLPLTEVDLTTATSSTPTGFDWNSSDARQKSMEMAKRFLSQGDRSAEYKLNALDVLFRVDGPFGTEESRKAGVSVLSAGTGIPAEEFGKALTKMSEIHALVFTGRTEALFNEFLKADLGNIAFYQKDKPASFNAEIELLFQVVNRVANQLCASPGDFTFPASEKIKTNEGQFDLNVPEQREELREKIVSRFFTHNKGDVHEDYLRRSLRSLFGRSKFDMIETGLASNIVGDLAPIAVDSISNTAERLELVLAKLHLVYDKLIDDKETNSPINLARLMITLKDTPLQSWTGMLAAEPAMADFANNWNNALGLIASKVDPAPHVRFASQPPPERRTGGRDLRFTTEELFLFFPDARQGEVSIGANQTEQLDVEFGQDGKVSFEMTLDVSDPPEAVYLTTFKPDLFGLEASLEKIEQHCKRAGFSQLIIQGSESTRSIEKAQIRGYNRDGRHLVKNL